MKLTKSLFLAFAGLGLFACSNEDVADNGIKGDATVGIHIAGVASRAEGTQAVDVETVTVTLSASSAKEELTKTFTTIEDANQWKWTEVRNPRSITVSVNGGKPADQTYTIQEVQKDNYAAPLYETTSSYTTSNDNGTPLYTYSLELENTTIARVEFSDISHGTKDHASLGCYFSQINWNGVFLNNIKAVSNEGSTKYESWDKAVLKTSIEGSFMGAWASSSTYAWNVFPGTPTLTFSFKNIELANGVEGGNTFVDGNGYAAVTGYVTEEGEPITSFEAGKIYKITGIVIEDSYIGGTVDPTKPVNVQAVVTIQDWSIVNGTVTWN